MSDNISQNPSGSTVNIPAEDVNLNDILNQMVPEPTEEVQGQNDKPSVEVDAKYKDLPLEEGIFRTLQSERDQARHLLKKEIKEKKSLEELKEVFDLLYTDDTALEAFLSERKPDWMPKRDKTSEFKAVIAKEFGENFTPSMTREEAESEDPFGTDALYYLRVDELKRELLKPSTKKEIKGLKEYKAAIAQKEADERKELEEEIKSVQTKYNLPEEEIKATLDWGLTLKFDQLYKIRQFLLRMGRPAGNPAPGAIRQTNVSAAMKSIFGEQAKIIS